MADKEEAARRAALIKAWVPPLMRRSSTEATDEEPDEPVEMELRAREGSGPGVDGAILD